MGGVPISPSQGAPKPKFSLSKDWASPFPCFFQIGGYFFTTSCSLHMICWLAVFVADSKVWCPDVCTNTAASCELKMIVGWKSEARNMILRLQDGWLCLNFCWVISIGWFLKDVYILYIYIVFVWCPEDFRRSKILSIFRSLSSLVAPKLVFCMRKWLSYATGWEWDAGTQAQFDNWWWLSSWGAPNKLQPMAIL